MNSKIGVVIVVGILVIVGWAVWARGDQSAMETSDAMMTGDTSMEKKDAEAMMLKEETSMQSDEGVMMEKKETMMQAGSYEAYTSEKLAKAATGDVVLFFRASWCPTCKAADADIRANLGKIPANLTILDVNYDTAADLKKKYGVTYQHTFVQVNADGTQIKKWSGSATLAALVAEVQ